LGHARLDLRPPPRRVWEVGGGDPHGGGGGAGRGRRQAGGNAQERGESQEMSASSATAHAHVEHAAHHELSFVRTYIFSTDHKMIARQFLFMGLFMMVIGGLLALIVRWQLAWPETAVPGLGGILQETGGILEPSRYNMAVTMHATIMTFILSLPILAASLGYFFLMPIVGEDRVAF